VSGVRHSPENSESAGSVGENENSLASVGGSHVRRGETTPLRIEPEPGQIPQNGSHSPVIFICALIHWIAWLGVVKVLDG
jgi:hypothetical protein